MYISELLEKLFEIERSIGVEEPCVVRSKVMDAQECILQMQKEMAEVLRIAARSDMDRAKFPFLALGAPRTDKWYLPGCQSAALSHTGNSARNR
jgi:hypothetical protein